MFVLGIFFLSIFGILLLNGIQTFYKKKQKRTKTGYTCLLYLYFVFTGVQFIWSEVSHVFRFFCFFFKEKKKIIVVVRMGINILCLVFEVE